MKSKQGQGVDSDQTESETWSLRPSKEIRELVQAAVDATGLSRSELVWTLIREQLPKLVEKTFAERTAKEADFRANALRVVREMKSALRHRESK